MKKEESVLRSVLMQKVASRGINKDRLDRALETLLAEESIEDQSTRNVMELSGFQ